MSEHLHVHETHPGIVTGDAPNKKHSHIVGSEMSATVIDTPTPMASTAIAPNGRGWHDVLAQIDVAC